MKKVYIVALACAALTLAGCSKKSENSEEPGKRAVQTTMGEVRLANTVNSVMLRHPADSQTAIVIYAAGTADGIYWTASLAPVSDPTSDATVQSYRFEVTALMNGEATTTNPIDVQLRVDSLPPGVKAVRILSSTNEMSANLPRS